MIEKKFSVLDIQDNLNLEVILNESSTEFQRLSSSLNFWS